MPDANHSSLGKRRSTSWLKRRVEAVLLLRAVSDWSETIIPTDPADSYRHIEPAVQVIIILLNFLISSVLIYSHIGIVVAVSMGYAADNVLMVEHFPLMQQCR